MRGKTPRLGFLVALAGLVLALGACQPAVDPGSSTAMASQPAGVEVSVLRQQLQTLETQLQDERSKRAELEGQLEESRQTLEVRTAMLEGLLVEAQAMDRLQEEKRELERLVTTVQDTTKALGNDRQLLIELRKDAPQEGEAALGHWRNIKTLAVQADPSLARPVDRVLSVTSAYFAWAEKDHANQQERIQDYYASGADQYPTQAEEFSKAVLLTLINRLDAFVQQAGGG